MTSIEAVSSYLPPHGVPIERCLAGEGLDAAQIEFHRRVFGNERVRREAGTSATDLLMAAVTGLDALRGQEHRVRYLVHARTIQLGAHGRSPLRELRDKLGLPSAHTFSVSQHACASGLLAVDVCGRLLAADGDPDALALLVAGEKAFSPVTRLMGPAVLAEGTAAVLVGIRDAGDPLLGYATRTHGQFNDPLGTPEELQPAFNELSPVCLADVVSTAVERAGLVPADIALILPYNINKTGLVRLARALGMPAERVFLDNLVDLGHCFCADAFINYRAAVDQGRLRPGDHYVMAALGAGATWAAMTFQYRGRTSRSADTSASEEGAMT